MKYEVPKDTSGLPDHKTLRGRLGASRWQNWLSERTLAFQFVVASGILIVVAAGIAGLLITEQVSKNTLNDRAAASALFMQSILSPFTAELATGRILSRSSKDALDQVFSDEEFRSRFPHLELWRADGTLQHRNRRVVAMQAAGGEDVRA